MRDKVICRPIKVKKIMAKKPHAMVTVNTSRLGSDTPKRVFPTCKTCGYLAETRSHPWADDKPMSHRTGYACVLFIDEGIVITGWSKNSIGCECHYVKDKRKKKKEIISDSPCAYCCNPKKDENYCTYYCDKWDNFIGKKKVEVG